MSVSGPQAMRALDDALRDIRREEDDITKRIARANERVGKLRETELGQLRALSAVRLSPEVQGELAGTLSQAESRARDMLKGHAAAMADMEKVLADKEAELAKLSTERQELLENTQKWQAEIDALDAPVKAALANDAAYGALIAERAETDKVATEADRKADMAEADREEKGKPYREDPLFSYLWDRGYGTGAYKAGNITRMLDDWVARLVGFANARPNYAMLIAIPDRFLDATGNVLPLADIEKDLIAFAIDHNAGRMAQVARQLGIGRSTLYRKLKEYGLEQMGATHVA